MSESDKILNSQLETNQSDMELQTPTKASTNPNQTNLNSSSSQKRKQLEDLPETESKAKLSRSNEDQYLNELFMVRLLTWNIDGLGLRSQFPPGFVIIFVRSPNLMRTADVLTRLADPCKR